MTAEGQVVFCPGKLRSFTFSLYGGVEPSANSFDACLDCGFLWGQIDQTKLQAFIRKHCTEQSQRECGVIEQDL
jgi:hypothetical protein